jgi:hypothetical protein
MIVRAILRCPELADHFDHFNDFKDTSGWLRGLVARDEAGRFAQIALKRLEAQHKVWLQKRLLEKK